MPLQMETVLSLGISPDKIILANCCKRPRDLRMAAASKVDLTTFDTVSELKKMARMHPGASGVLRIRADDPGARCPLGNKYGAEPEQVADLLRVGLLSSLDGYTMQSDAQRLLTHRDWSGLKPDSMHKTTLVYEWRIPSC